MRWLCHVRIRYEGLAKKMDEASAADDNQEGGQEGKYVGDDAMGESAMAAAQRKKGIRCCLAESSFPPKLSKEMTLKDRVKKYLVSHNKKDNVKTRQKMVKTSFHSVLGGKHHLLQVGGVEEEGAPSSSSSSSGGGQQIHQQHRIGFSGVRNLEVRNLMDEGGRLLGVRHRHTRISLTPLLYFAFALLT